MIIKQPAGLLSYLKPCRITHKVRIQTNGIDLSRQICKYFAHVMQVPVDESTGMLADYLKFKRFELQASLVEKIKAIIDSRPCLKNLRAVPPKIALPIFYGASIEEDDDLHTIWARLLASAMDPEQPKLRTAFADILRQLEGADVGLLTLMYSYYNYKIEKIFKYKRDGNPKNVSLSVYS
jgi:hypothetical protein